MAGKGAGFIFLRQENKPGTFFCTQKPGDGTPTESYVWPQ